MDQDALNRKLFSAVAAHDVTSVGQLMALGADPFANVGPVELHILKDNIDVRLGSGCSAALAIQFPHLLDILLPQRMNGWPMITQAVDVFGVVCTKGQGVDLAQWAIELSALPSLRFLIERLDRSHPDSTKSLNRLAMSCLSGCSYENAKDDALTALMICMAAQPELDRGWSHWRHARLASQSAQHEPMYMPMTFVMASMVKKKASLFEQRDEAMRAFAWALSHDDPVRDGDRRMGNVSEDTILHLGASSGCVVLLRIALEQGCNLEARDLQGLTPLELAVECKQFEAVAFIESWISQKAVERAMGAIAAMGESSTHHKQNFCVGVMS
jgi:ankyrin repeat protein